MLGELLAEENIRDAIEDLKSKKDSCGIDGIMISAYEEYWNINGEMISQSVREGRYIPSPVQEIEILKVNGRKRWISKFTCTDRVLLRAIKNILEPVWEKDFSEYSFAYRKNKGTAEAVKAAAAYMSDGYRWVLELDLDNFFDSIDLDLMAGKLKARILDERLLSLLNAYLHGMMIRENFQYKKSKGLVQGSPISPLLSNIYMMECDEFLEGQYKFCRFSDNINIYFKDQQQALKAYQEVEQYLREHLRLNLNKEKCGVFQAFHRAFLGYTFYKSGKGSTIEARRRISKETQVYNTWHKSAITKIDQQYHLIHQGILTQKDYSVLFENASGKYYIPVEVVDTINIYSSVVFSSRFLETMSRHGLAVSVHDRYGECVGKFIPTWRTQSVKTLLKQTALYCDEKKRLKLAREMELAAIHNLRENLRYYLKQKHREHLRESIDKMSQGMTQLNEARSVENLLLIEARMRQEYFSCWDCIIGEPQYIFEKRTRQPPQNCINALISFGNVFLYNRIAVEIGKTSLDIRIGICHAANRRSESLNLDVADIFKPIIVDRVIFSCIHNHQLKAELHFENGPKGGIYLNPEGKRIFIRALEQKLYQRITIKGQEVSYQTLLRNEIQKIFRTIQYDEKYKPYKYH